jgi:hypothetical protein
MVSVIYEYQKKYIQEYQLKNKDKLAEYQKQKILCEICNCVVKRNGLSVHKKSKKHLKKLNIIE